MTKRERISFLEQLKEELEKENDAIERSKSSGPS
jgi:hypothetical protein